MVDFIVPKMVLPLTDEQYKILGEMADSVGCPIIEYADRMIKDILLSHFNARLMVYRNDNPEPNCQQN